MKQMRSIVTLIVWPHGSVASGQLILTSAVLMTSKRSINTNKTYYNRLLVRRSPGRDVTFGDAKNLKDD